MVKNHVALAD